MTVFALANGLAALLIAPLSCAGLRRSLDRWRASIQMSLEERQAAAANLAEVNAQLQRALQHSEEVVNQVQQLTELGTHAACERIAR